jgi:serine/threonine protein kinase
VRSGDAAGSELGPGSVIAGYRIEAQISHGGMATVFRAHDERLGRTVALKILAPELASDREFRARFVRESRATAITDHPHVIPVFEAGQAGGVLFIAMRFVRGGDLGRQLSKVGPLPPDSVANYVSQAASALDAAHMHGLVHRDVKPGNLLLDVGHDSGTPDHLYLSDFGLSKNSLTAGTRTALTAAGQVIGTLDYMAPEQIDGRPIGGRADQYGLACTAYELLCGTPPFGECPDTALMRAHRSASPPPLTSRRHDLPAGADAVFARSLAKAANDRFRSCGDFAAALRVALSRGPGRPVRQDPAARAGPIPGTASQAADPRPITPPVAAPYPSTAPTIVRRNPAALRHTPSGSARDPAANRQVPTGSARETSSIYTQRTEQHETPTLAPAKPAGESEEAQPGRRRRWFGRRGHRSSGGTGAGAPNVGPR